MSSGFGVEGFEIQNLGCDRRSANGKMGDKEIGGRVMGRKENKEIEEQEKGRTGRTERCGDRLRDRVGQ